MADQILLDAYIVVNGTNLSNKAQQVTVSRSAKPIDTTAFGTGGNASNTPGLSSDKFDVLFKQDFTAASVNAVLGPLKTNGTAFTVEVRPTSAAVSTGNPKYTATCKLFDYTPLDGKVGDLSTAKVTFMADGAPIAEAFA